MALLDDVKTVLRISNTAYDTEINDLISAAKAELGLSGVIDIQETDTLIKKAINTYVKANFGWDNPDAKRLQDSFEAIKAQLTLSTDYSYFTVNFAIADLETELPVRADVTFCEKTLTTDAAGQIEFYTQKGNALVYIVEAEGYSTVEGIIDIVAPTTLIIELEKVV